MNLNELKTFLAIIEGGSLVRASETLNVTQSTVTARLQSLEGALGQTLLYRQKSGTTLTAAGERLRNYAATINDLWTQARQDVALPDGLSAMCNMACEPDLWDGAAAKMFEYVRAHQSGVALSVWQSGPGEVTQWLAQGLADVAMTYQPSNAVKMLTVELTADTLILVSDRMDTPTQPHQGYIFVAGGMDFGRDHATANTDAAISHVSFGSAKLGLAHLLAEGGSAYLPERLVTLHLANQRLYPLDAPTYRRPVYLVANRQAIANWAWFDDCVSALQG